MDKRDQEIAALQSAPRAVVAYAIDYPSGEVIAFHSHPRAQLIHALEGVIAINIDNKTYLLPPGRALWVPVNVRHQLTMKGNVAIRTLYVAPEEHTKWLPAEPVVIQVSSLLKELIIRAIALPTLYQEEGPDGLLMALALEELRIAREQPLEIPLPQDPRLLMLVDKLMDSPGNQVSVESWAAEANMTARTLSRQFTKEVGMSPGVWIQQARLTCSLVSLCLGKPVGVVALDLGYSSPSAYINAFKKVFGVTPGEYIKDV